MYTLVSTEDPCRERARGIVASRRFGQDCREPDELEPGSRDNEVRRDLYSRTR